MQTRDDLTVNDILRIADVSKEELIQADKLLKVLRQCTPLEMKRVIETYFQPDTEFYKHYEYHAFNKPFWEGWPDYFASFLLMAQNFSNILRFSSMYLLDIRRERARLNTPFNKTNDPLARCEFNPIIAALSNLEYLIQVYESRDKLDIKIRQSTYEQKKAREKKLPIPAIYKPLEFDVAKLIPASFNNFQGMDLTDFDLRGYDLRASLLHGANMTRCNLSGCQLDGLAIMINADQKDSVVANASAHRFFTHVTITSQVQTTDDLRPGL